MQFTQQVLGEGIDREMIMHRWPTARTFPVVVVDGLYIGGHYQLESYLKINMGDKRELLEE